MLVKTLFKMIVAALLLKALNHSFGGYLFCLLALGQVLPSHRKIDHCVGRTKFITNLSVKFTFKSF